MKSGLLLNQAFLLKLYHGTESPDQTLTNYLESLGMAGSSLSENDDLLLPLPLTVQYFNLFPDDESSFWIHQLPEVIRGQVPVSYDIFPGRLPNPVQTVRAYGDNVPSNEGASGGVKRRFDKNTGQTIKRSGTTGEGGDGGDGGEGGSNMRVCDTCKTRWSIDGVQCQTCLNLAQSRNIQGLRREPFEQPSANREIISSDEMTELSKNIPAEWYSLGVILGVPTGDLDSIRVSILDPSPSDKALRMLIAWAESQTASIPQLAEALTKTGRRDLANKFKGPEPASASQPSPTAQQVLQRRLVNNSASASQPSPSTVGDDLSESELLDISRFIRDEWREIGLSLGVENSVMDSIDLYRTPQQKALKMLMALKHKGNAKRSLLAPALRDAGMDQLADELQKVNNVSTGNRKRSAHSASTSQPSPSTVGDDLSDSELLDISKSIPDKWIDIGLSLGLGHSVIGNIDCNTNYRTPQQKALQMLMALKHKRNAKRSLLAPAFRGANMDQLADELQKVNNVSTGNRKRSAHSASTSQPSPSTVGDDLSDSELVDISRSIPDKWIDIGLSLGLKHSVIDNINYDTNYRTPQQKALQMLMALKHKGNAKRSLLAQWH